MESLQIQYNIAFYAFRPWAFRPGLAIVGLIVLGLSSRSKHERLCVDIQAAVLFRIKSDLKDVQQSRCNAVVYDFMAPRIQSPRIIEDNRWHIGCTS